MTKAYFISDLHLASMQDPNSQTLLRFLRELREDEGVTHLFLVGDIFDLWIHSHEYFVTRFGPLIDEIRRLVDKGVRVHFFEGNHDLYLRDFWQGSLGVHVHEAACYFELAGRRVRVEHGDLMNPDDRGYLFLRAFLRTRAMRFIARHLPGPVVSWIGEKASQASRQYSSSRTEGQIDQIRNLIHAHAARACLERPFDLLVSGHVHVVDDCVFDAPGAEIGGPQITGENSSVASNFTLRHPVRSINLGSWLDGAKALRLTESGCELVALDPAEAVGLKN